MNIKLAGGVLFTTLVIALGAIGVGAIKEPPKLLYANNIVDRCASINFGMSEPNYNLPKEQWAGTGSLELGLRAADNEAIEDSDILSYEGSTYYHKKDFALKLSSSSNF